MPSRGNGGIFEAAAKARNESCWDFLAELVGKKGIARTIFERMIERMIEDYLWLFRSRCVGLCLFWEFCPR
jgi:hypothetical protein